MKFKDLEEREGQITGGNVNFTNEDVISTMFGGDGDRELLIRKTNSLRNY